MFSGIVEFVTQVTNIEKEGTNFKLTIKNPFKEAPYIDQSIAHDGVCLTVVKSNQEAYVVEAIDETLKKTNLKEWRAGSNINIERSLLASSRMDGHIVQGHVDNTAAFIDAKDQDGSWLFRFRLDDEGKTLVIPKGSICINGISLTVADIQENIVTVAIIPYTYEHTNLKNLSSGQLVNIEYDVLGKYVVNYLKRIKM